MSQLMTTNNLMCLTHPECQVHLGVSCSALINWNNNSKMASYKLNKGEADNAILMSNIHNIGHKFNLI